MCKNYEITDLLEWAVENIDDWPEEYPNLLADASDNPVFFGKGAWILNTYTNIYHSPLGNDSNWKKVVNKKEPFKIAKPQFVSREKWLETCSSKSKTKGHIHAESMKMYAEDAAETNKPWERWQYNKDGIWLDFSYHPHWNPNYNYRRKPKTRTVNGFEFEWEAATDRENYYVAHPMDCTYYVRAKNDNAFGFFTGRSLAAKTQSMAIAHAKAMLGIDPNV